jgi:hypothetical protein
MRRSGCVVAALKLRSWALVQSRPQKAMQYAHLGSSRPSTNERMEGKCGVVADRAM